MPVVVLLDTNVWVSAFINPHLMAQMEAHGVSVLSVQQFLERLASGEL